MPRSSVFTQFDLRWNRTQDQFERFTFLLSSDYDGPIVGIITIEFQRADGT